MSGQLRWLWVAANSSGTFPFLRLLRRKMSCCETQIWCAQFKWSWQCWRSQVHKMMVLFFVCRYSIKYPSCCLIFLCLTSTMTKFFPSNNLTKSGESVWKAQVSWTLAGNWPGYSSTMAVLGLHDQWGPLRTLDAFATKELQSRQSYHCRGENTQDALHCVGL